MIQSCTSDLILSVISLFLPFPSPIFIHSLVDYREFPSVAVCIKYQPNLNLPQSILLLQDVCVYIVCA